MQKHCFYKSKKIVYRTQGEGKPVILVHGFGETSAVWDKQVDFLKKYFRIIVPDLPGSGDSELLDDMSIEEMAESIHAIIHEENIEQCPVIGHSMGGYITLALVEHYWNHVSSFGLFHSTAYADSEEKKATRRKGIEFMQQHGGFEFLKTTTPNLFSSITKENNPQLVSNFISSLSNFTTTPLVEYYKAMMARPDRTHVLKEINVPVLFVAGETDNAVPKADIIKQSHLPGLSYIHILAQSGHMGMLEETEKSNQLLFEFLQKK